MEEVGSGQITTGPEHHYKVHRKPFEVLNRRVMLFNLYFKNVTLAVLWETAFGGSKSRSRVELP